MKNVCKSITLLLVIYCAATLFFQADRALAAENYPAYIFNDRVIMRSTPTTKGTVLSVLPIGTKITVLEDTEEKMTLNGIEDVWVRALAGKQTGYIWGGLLCYFSAADDFDRDGTKEQFLYKSFQKKGGGSGIAAKIFRGSKVVTEHRSGVNYICYARDVRVEKKYPFTPRAVFITAGFALEGPTYGNGVRWYIFKNKKLHLSLEVKLEEGEGQAGQNSRLIFPGMAKGEPDHLVIETKQMNCYDETEKNPCKEETGYFRYKWDGTIFHRVK